MTEALCCLIPCDLEEIRILLEDCLKDINHNGVVTLIRRAIKNKTVPKNYKKVNSSSYHNKVGVPQGLSISNVLAGIYMKEFDIEFNNVGLTYMRYVDDILIFAKQHEINAIEQKVESALINIGLETRGC
jgi:retron-type reverse transcriptase